MCFSIIPTISPLYRYWNSDQNDKDEDLRLNMANESSPAVNLFRNEPYKWENLYQSIIREIIKGDYDSIKGLKVLMDTVNLEEQEKMFQAFSSNNLFDEEIILILKSSDVYDIPTKKNLFRFIRILISIFTNPYRIRIKRKKSHLYEYTGGLFDQLRRNID